VWKAGDCTNKHTRRRGPGEEKRKEGHRGKEGQATGEEKAKKGGGGGRRQKTPVGNKGGGGKEKKGEGKERNPGGNIFLESQSLHREGNRSSSELRTPTKGAGTLKIENKNRTGGPVITATKSELKQTKKRKKRGKYIKKG